MESDCLRGAEPPFGGTMEFIGNVNTGVYELHNISRGCWYRLAPK